MTSLSTEPGYRAVSARWEGLLDLVAVIATVVEAIRQSGQGTSPLEVGLLVGAFTTVAVRRRWPAAAGVAAILIAATVLAEPSSAVAIWTLVQVVVLHLALHGRRRTALAVATVVGLVLYVGTLVVSGLGPLDPGALVYPSWTAAVVGAGLTIRAHREQLMAVAQTAAAVVAARDSDIERHVADERLRIARDLHDSVAHSMAVISVHANAAAHALPGRPKDGRRSIAEVQLASRTVIAEMQHIVRLLRTEGDDSISGDGSLVVITPRGLAETARALGTVVHTRLPSDEVVANLDPVTATTVARVVQESLTNARKHGEGPVDLAVQIDSASVTITVSNAWAILPRLAGPDVPAGFGLLGMRERLTAVGGQLEISVTGRQFRLEAAVPRIVTGGEPS